MILQISRVTSKSLKKVNQFLPLTAVIGNSTNPNANHLEQKRNISCIQSRHFRDKSIKKPDPWPYKEKKFTLPHGFIDNTMKRFDDNTRIIVVEGNIGAGKTTVAKKLAEELEMEYLPEVSANTAYLTEYGFDMRSLDHLMPDSLKSCDLERFYKDPHNCQVPNFQHIMYALRLEQYIDALAHLLNTGQGVVLERSVYSDFVFMEAMHKMGYLSSQFKDHYNIVKKNTILELLKPHMVLYLDVPVDTCLERIQKRNLSHEKNSKVLTKEYLKEIEHQYKHYYLKDISLHSEVLIFDWSNFGDMEAVIDDIEKVDFDNYDKYDLKLRDWRDDDAWHWNDQRRMYTNTKWRFLSYLNIPVFTVPEMLISGDDQLHIENVLDKIPEFKYAKGFNKEIGEKGWLFKSSSNYWEDQKLQFFKDLN